VNGWLVVLGAWILFGGGHLLLSSRPVRGALIGRLGPQPFRGVYSLMALGTFALLVWAYAGSKHTGPLLWNLATVPGIRRLSVALTAVGLTLVVAAFFQPKPTDMVPSAGKRAAGLARITRHPAFAALGLVACSHMLLNSHLSDVVFWAGFPIFTWFGCRDIDARKRAADPEGLADYFAETSLVPFAAIAAGRNRLVLSELPVVGLVAGAVVTGLVYRFHTSLFGP